MSEYIPTKADAQAEAERRWPSPNSGLYEGLQLGFVLGAEYAASRLVTSVPIAEAIEDLAYLITAHRFRERGLRGVILEPDIAVARPMAKFLVGEGYAPGPVITEEAVERAARALWVSQQDDQRWARAVVEDVFSPADDYPDECMSMLAQARAALSAAWGTEGSKP